MKYLQLQSITAWDLNLRNFALMPIVLSDELWMKQWLTGDMQAYVEQGIVPGVLEVKSCPIAPRK